MGRKRFIFDVVVLAVYLAAANPAAAGIPVHEWLGLGAAVVLAVHLALGVGRLGRAHGADGRVDAARAVRIVLAAALAAALALCVVSGIMVSGTVLLQLGFVAYGYYFWDPLHAASAKALLALIVVHVALHGRLVAGWVRNRFADDKEASDGR